MSKISIHESIYNLGNMELAKGLFDLADTLVLGIGPPACLRVLYFRAMACGKLSNLRLIPLTSLDYTFGDYVTRLRDTLDELLDQPAYKGIVLYISCPDIISQTDFDRIINQVKNPKAIPIEIFKRGPMERRKNKPLDRLKTIARKIEDFSKSNDFPLAPAGGLCPPPPPVADYSGMTSLFPQDKGVGKFLFTPSGCASCPSSIDNLNQANFIYSKFDDLQVATGYTREMSQEVLQDIGDKEYGQDLLLSIATPVTYMTGMMDNKVEPGNYFKEVFNTSTNGFASGEEALHRALLEMAQEFIKKPVTRERSINILGYSPFLFGNLDRLAEIEGYIRQLGYSVHYPGYGSWESFKNSAGAGLNLVFSRSGLELAQWLEDEFRIPYIDKVPMGISGFNTWLQDLGQALELTIPREWLMEKDEVQEVGNRVLLVGTSELLDNLQVFMEEDFGCPSFRSLEPSYDHIDKKAISHIIGDPLYKAYFKDHLAGVEFIPLPHPSISGNTYLDLEYEYMGQKGYGYFKEFFKDRR